MKYAQFAIAFYIIVWGSARNFHNSTGCDGVRCNCNHVFPNSKKEGKQIKVVRPDECNISWPSFAMPDCRLRPPGLLLLWVLCIWMEKEKNVRQLMLDNKVKRSTFLLHFFFLCPRLYIWVIMFCWVQLKGILPIKAFESWIQGKTLILIAMINVTENDLLFYFVLKQLLIWCTLIGLKAFAGFKVFAGGIFRFE